MMATRSLYKPNNTASAYALGYYKEMPHMLVLLILIVLIVLMVLMILMVL